MSICHQKSFSNCLIFWRKPSQLFTFKINYSIKKECNMLISLISLVFNEIILNYLVKLKHHSKMIFLYSLKFLYQRYILKNQSVYIIDKKGFKEKHIYPLLWCYVINKTNCIILFENKFLKLFLLPLFLSLTKHETSSKWQIF